MSYSSSSSDEDDAWHGKGFHRGNSHHTVSPSMVPSANPSSRRSQHGSSTNSRIPSRNQSHSRLSSELTTNAHSQGMNSHPHTRNQASQQQSPVQGFPSPRSGSIQRGGRQDQPKPFTSTPPSKPLSSRGAPKKASNSISTREAKDAKKAAQERQTRRTSGGNVSNPADQGTGRATSSATQAQRKARPPYRSLSVMPDSTRAHEHEHEHGHQMTSYGTSHSMSYEHDDDDNHHATSATPLLQSHFPVSKEGTGGKVNSFNSAHAGVDSPTSAHVANAAPSSSSYQQSSRELDEGQAKSSINSMKKYSAPQIHEKCPTCNGKGKIKKELHSNPNEMVALIPYSDKRLKPRHTRLKVGIAIVVTVAIVASIVAVIFPQPVDIKVSDGRAFDLNISCMAIPNENRVKELNMTVLWYFSVKNYNHFPVTFKPASLHLTTVFNSSISQSTLLIPMVPTRKTKMFAMNVTVHFTRDAQHIYKNSCSKSVRSPYNHFPVNFVLQSTAQILTFNQAISLVRYPMIVCPVPPSPIGPSNSSTTTPVLTTTTPITTPVQTTKAPPPPPSPPTTTTTTTTVHEGGLRGSERQPSTMSPPNTRDSSKRARRSPQAQRNSLFSLSAITRHFLPSHDGERDGDGGERDSKGEGDEKVAVTLVDEIGVVESGFGGFGGDDDDVHFLAPQHLYVDSDSLLSAGWPREDDSLLSREGRSIDDDMAWGALPCDS